MSASLTTPDRTTMLILPAVGVWMVTAVLLGAAGVFTADETPLALAVAVVSPPLIVVGLLTWSSWFQTWARSLDLRILAMLQMWRIGGFAILAAWGVGALPGEFALPAGLGDTFVAVTAPFAAWAIARRGGKRIFLAWTAIGIADLAVALTLGMLYAPEVGALAGSGTTLAMSELPLSFIPTFGVPLMLSVHFVSLYNARSHDWTAATPERVRARHA